MTLDVAERVVILALVCVWAFSTIASRAVAKREELDREQAANRRRRLTYRVPRIEERIGRRL